MRACLRAARPTRLPGNAPGHYGCAAREDRGQPCETPRMLADDISGSLNSVKSASRLVPEGFFQGDQFHVIVLSLTDVSYGRAACLDDDGLAGSPAAQELPACRPGVWRVFRSFGPW